MSLLPINISFENWTSQLRNTFSDRNIPQLSRGISWQEWVKMLLLEGGFDSYHIPRPEGFTKWEDWAAQFLISTGS